MNSLLNNTILRRAEHASRMLSQTMAEVHRSQSTKNRRKQEQRWLESASRRLARSTFQKRRKTMLQSKQHHFVPTIKASEMGKSESVYKDIRERLSRAGNREIDEVKTFLDKHYRIAKNM